MSDKKNSTEIDLINIIEKTTSSVSNENCIEQLSEIVEKETTLDLLEAKETVDNISNTIDVIADNFQDLQNAKENGKSRTEWLKGKLDETIDKYKVENTEEFISEVKDSLKESNEKIGIEVFGKEIDISKPLTSSKYDNLNKTAIVNDFQEEIKNNTLLGAVVFENGKVRIDDKHKEIKAVKDYFEAKLDSPQDSTFKKAVSTATVIGQKKGILPKQIASKTPDEVAMIVDKGVTAAKVAYKLGNGELSPLDAVEYTIDRNVAVLNSAITTTCTRAGGVVGGKVGGVIGSIFGPAGTVAGAAIGTVVGKIGGYIVGEVIGEGVKKVASAVKSVAKSAWEGVKSVVSSAWDTVTGWFGF
jgi:hypothetical protein